MQLGPEVQHYSMIREEILLHIALLHWFTLAVAFVLLIGVAFVERRRSSVLSVFLPTLGIAWSAAVLRFDFMIHRGGAYLRTLEEAMRSNTTGLPLWETWKRGAVATSILMPAADLLSSLAILVPTLYLIHGPGRDHCSEYYPRATKSFVILATVSFIVPLLVLPFVPILAAWRP